MKTALLRLLACLIFDSTFAHARFVHSMSYGELVAKSDLIVLIEPFATHLASDTFPEIPAAESDRLFQAFNTDFKVRAVLQSSGNVPHELTVLHFLHTPGPIGPDAAEFVKFLGEGAPKNTTWIAFLKKRPDGRYEAITGQVDPAYSFSVFAFRATEFGSAADSADEEPRFARRPLSLVDWVFYAAGLFGGLALLPYTAHPGASQWLRAAFWLCSSSLIVWSMLGLTLLCQFVPFSLHAYALLGYIQTMLFGMALGLLVLIFASGELVRGFSRRKNAI